MLQEVDGLVLAVEIFKDDVIASSSHRGHVDGPDEIGDNACTNGVIAGHTLCKGELVHFTDLAAMATFVH